MKGLRFDSEQQRLYIHLFSLPTFPLGALLQNPHKARHFDKNDRDIKLFVRAIYWFVGYKL